MTGVRVRVRRSLLRVRVRVSCKGQAFCRNLEIQGMLCVRQLGLALEFEKDVGVQVRVRFRLGLGSG